MGTTVKIIWSNSHPDLYLLNTKVLTNDGPVLLDTLSPKQLIVPAL